MGKYQQWLHYREVEQQLQTQMEVLKKELGHLQAQYQQQHRPEVLSDESSNLILHALAVHFSEQPPSPSLRSMTSYPGMPQASQPTSSSEPDPTEPQIEIPHWLRNLATAPGTNGPVDQESLRNNRLVQRWVERWRKQPPDSINNRRESS